MIRFPLRRVLSSVVAVALVLSCAGPGGTAAAQIATRVAPVEGSAPVALPRTAFSASSALSFGAPSLGAFAAPSAPALAAPALNPAAALPSAAPALVPSAAPAAAALPLSAVPAAVPSAAPTAAPALAPATAKTLSAASTRVDALIKDAGPVANSDASAASTLGRRLEEILTGAPALAPAADLAAPSQGPFASFSSDSHQLARPAGDSIRQAVDNEPTAPVAAQAPAPRGPKTPFWPKLLTAALALTPALWFGLPLIGAGSLLLGSVVLASGASLAVMPFLGEASPKLLRAAPGAALVVLGGAAALSGLWAPAAFALIGGWGLTRYGLGKSSVPRYEAAESLSAWFGGVAALTTVALAAATPAGWLAAALPFVSYPVSAALWLHLPSWMGQGVAAVGVGLFNGARGLTRVSNSIRRDTTLWDRLQKFSERHFEASKWNAVWLSLIWTPIVLIEAAKWVVGAAVGLYAGAVSAPAMALWGASHELAPKSKATAFFAAWARFPYDRIQNGKKNYYNPLAARLVPLANSDSFVRRAAGSAGLGLLQLGWALYALVGSPVLSLVGFFAAFGKAASADGAAALDPFSLPVSRDDAIARDGSTPPVDAPAPTTPGKAPFAPKLIAAALAAVPAAWFGWQVFLGGALIQLALFAPLALALVAMPFMGPRAPKFVKSLPGRLLTYNGLVLFLSGHALIAGALAFLGGWGFERWVASLDDGKTRRFDDAEELGSFFGALGLLTGVGAAWIGLGGLWGSLALALAAGTGLFLDAHLPQWVFEGLLGAAKGLWDSARAYSAALGGWRDDTKFLSNLRKHANYWLEKTFWNGVWLSAIWVPMGLLMAAESVLAVVVGAVTGLLRAPLAFVAAALKEARPNGRAARGFAAALAAWKSVEGRKDILDGVARGGNDWMNRASATTGRPTFVAALAFLGREIVDAVWLIGTIVVNVLPFGFLYGAYRGVRAALAPAPVEKK